MTYVAPVPPWLRDASEPSEKSRKRRLSASLDVAFSHEAAALVIVERFDQRIEIVEHDFREPDPAEPFETANIIRLYIDRIVAIGCKHVTIDASHVDAFRFLGAARGLLTVAAPTLDGKSKAWILARDRVRERAVSLPKPVAAQLSKIVAKPRAAGGLTIEPPKVAGMGHCELASVAVNAIWLDSRLYGAIGGSPIAPKAHRGRWGAP